MTLTLRVSRGAKLVCAADGHKRAGAYREVHVSCCLISTLSWCSDARGGGSVFVAQLTIYSPEWCSCRVGGRLVWCEDGCDWCMRKWSPGTAPQVSDDRAAATSRGGVEGGVALGWGILVVVANVRPGSKDYMGICLRDGARTWLRLCTVEDSI
jgi:hypothetical protein